MTTCYLVAIFQKTIFQSIKNKIIIFSDIMWSKDSFSEVKSVTKSRVHCTLEEVKFLSNPILL